MYNLIACQNCKYSEELQIFHGDGTTSIYICYKKDSKEFGLLHAWFFECRMHEKDFLPQ